MAGRIGPGSGAGIRDLAGLSCILCSKVWWGTLDAALSQHRPLR